MTSHLSEFVQGRSDYEKVYRALDNLLDAAITLVAEADHPASSLGNISKHAEVRDLREKVNAAKLLLREAPYGGKDIPPQAHSVDTLTPVLIEGGESAGAKETQWGVSLTSSNPEPEDYYLCNSKEHAVKLFEALKRAAGIAS